MNYLIPFIVFVTISINITLCQCGSYWSDLIKERIRGNLYREYCRTREGMKLFKGSVVKFKDSCFTCTCSDTGLFCEHSFGMSLWTPMGCRSVIDGCEKLLVDSRNEFLRCLSLIPTNKEETMVRHIVG